MSRQLAITIAFLKTKTDYKSDPTDTDAHLIAVDQETGKSVMLNLDHRGEKWQPLPRVPVHLLGPIDCAACGGGDAHADNCPEMLRLEATSFGIIVERDQCPFRLGGSHKGRVRCVLPNAHDGEHMWPADATQDDGLTPAHDERDLKDDPATRFALDTARDLTSDIYEDRH